MPDPVKRPLPPKEIQSNEELYRTGLRIEQLYNPAFEPEPYYQEALRRDPGDYRANTALGILYCKHGRFTEAEEILRAATRAATANYIRSKDCEANYYLGVALKAQGKIDAAFDELYRAVWDPAWQTAGYYSLAELSCLKGDYSNALDFADRSLAVNTLNKKALNLKSAILRKLGRFDAAERTAVRTRGIDPLDFWAMNEVCLALSCQGRPAKARESLDLMTAKMRGQSQSYLELAVDYGNAGFWDEAIDVLNHCVSTQQDTNTVFPLVYYYLGYYSSKNDNAQDADTYYKLANQMSPDYCFPFRFETADVLWHAINHNLRDARAYYYLGNLFYDHQPEQAIVAWQKSIELDNAFYMAHRNLGLAYSQVDKDYSKAIAGLEKAVELNRKDARLFYELDVLCEAAGQSPEKRLSRLEENNVVIVQRDDSLTRQIILLTRIGKLDEAIELLEDHHFYNWEGSGQIRNVYVDALLARGQEHYNAGKYQLALRDYEDALEFPENLAVGKPKRDPRLIQIHYLIGTAREALGEHAKAKDYYEMAATERAGGASEASYYLGLALRKLGRDDESLRLFQELVKRGLASLDAGTEADYFAKFGEKQSDRVRQAQAHYLAGLGYLGQGNKTEAMEQFKNALDLNPGHLGASALAQLP